VLNKIYLFVKQILKIHISNKRFHKI
jgi:hypothetical protein